MNVRVSQPIQYVIDFEFIDRAGQIVREAVRYGFSTEPSAFKVKMVARNIEQGILNTIPGLTFVSYDAKRV